MPQVTFKEWGSDPSGSLAPYGSISPSITSDTTIFRNGKRSIKVPTGSPATTAQMAVLSPIALSDAGTRISFGFYFDTAAPANAQSFFRPLTGAAQIVHALGLNIDGTISNAPLGATAVNGTAVLVPNTWYRITLSYTITNSTTFRFDVYVNGVFDSSATAGTLTRTGTALPQWLISSTMGANVNYYFDDVYIDNGADYSDPGDTFQPLIHNAYRRVKVGNGMSRNEGAT